MILYQEDLIIFVLMQLSLFKPSQIFEAQYKLQGVLPKVFVQFYNDCEVKIPEKYEGSVLSNSIYDLKQHAIWLLARNNISNFLTDNDFVISV